jgi:YbbR domain-containing protein
MNQEYQAASQKSFFRWVPGIIRNDFWRKIIALFFAFLLYLMVTVRIGQEEKINNVPVILDLPVGLFNLEKQPPRVTVTVKGSKKKLKEVNAASLKIKAEVLDALFTPGVPYLLRLTPKNVNAPMGVSVVDIDPKDIQLNLDKKISKKVPVVAKFNSERNLPRDYAVGSVKFNPSEVLINGPESVVKDIDSVQTKPIPLDSQVMDSFEFTTALASQNSISISPSKVSAQVEIVKQYVSRTFKSIPIRLLGAPEEKGNYKIELLSSPHVAVTLHGPRGEIALLQAVAIKPYIDVSSFDEAGTFSVGVNCWVSSDGKVAVKNIYPAKVQIKITKSRK